MEPSDELERLRIALRIRLLEEVVASLARVLREAAPEPFGRWEERLQEWKARSHFLDLSELDTDAPLVYAQEYREAIEHLHAMIREHLE